VRDPHREDGIGQSTLIDPDTGAVTVLDRRSGGRLVDAWAGAALIRVGHAAIAS